jgi:dTDP-4-dehydrorhamnose reductase
MKNILITGSSGQLAQEIKKIVVNQNLENDNTTWIFVDKKILDICSEDAVKNLISSYNIDICVNCAAYTGVDEAEDDRENCIKVNTEAVGYLAKACKENNAKLIHISSDYVFDGTETDPYTESDTTNPVNFYGQTKLEGEKIALLNNPKTTIIRTSWLYSKVFGKNFYKTMLNLAKDKDEISVVSDQIGTPTNAADLAQFIVDIIYKDNDVTGIIHFAGDRVCSWAQFAQSIMDENNLNCHIVPILSNQYPTRAKRPAYSALCSTKELY